MNAACESCSQRPGVRLVAFPGGGPVFRVCQPCADLAVGQAFTALEDPA